MIIYLLTNTTNGKVYIGKTNYTAERRWSNHKAVAKRGKKCHLSAAIRKDGPEAFKLEVIAKAKSGSELNELEKRFIKKFDSMNPAKGYNIKEGGEGGLMREEFKEGCKRRRLGTKWPEEVKKKIAIARTGWRKRDIELPTTPKKKSGEGKTHGRTSTYRSGCRCELCKEARAASGRREWNKRHKEIQ